MKKELIIDTCVFVSALLSKDGASREVLKRCLNKEYSISMGTALYLEYESLLTRDDLFKECILSKSERETSFKSLPVSTNAGALELTEGRSSTVLAGLGPSLV